MSVLGLVNDRLRVPRLVVGEAAPQPAKATPASVATGPAAGEKRTSLMGTGKASVNQLGLPPRDALRQAIEAEAEAAGVAEQAAAAAARGQAGVDAARAALAPYAGLDAAVAQFHAAAARAGEAPGRELAADLLEGRRARAAALEALTDASAAAELLTGEADAAAAGLEAARAAVRGAAHGVADEQAVELATRLQALERQAAELREALGGYGRTRATDAPRPVPPAVVATVQAPWGEALLSAHARGMLSSVPAWQAFRGALATDPDAALEVAG